MTRHILLPTDFSGNARNAAIYAVNLFGTKDVKYTLLNVFIDPSSEGILFLAIADLLEAESVKELESERNYLVKYFKNDVDIEVKSREGYLSDVINNLNSEEKYDFVVMGAKGETGQKKSSMGSNTISVIKHCETPTISVPERAIYSHLDRMAVAIDKEKINHKMSFSSLAKLVREHSTELQFIHVQRESARLNEPLKDSDFEMPNYFKKEGVKYDFTVIQNENVAESILEFAVNKKVDMLVLISRKNTFFDRLIRKNAILEDAVMSDIPLLALHEVKI